MIKSISIAFLFLCGLMVACGNPETSEKTTTPEAEEALTIVNFDGLEAYLANRKSDYQVVNFWATWCKPCVEEMPYFKQLHEEIKSEGGEVILVSLDFMHQIDSKLKPFLEREQLNPAVVLLNDPKENEWIERVSSEWSGAIPATIIRKGDNRYFHEGKYPDYEKLKNQVNSFIKT